MKRLWKIIKAIGANLPFLLTIGAAFWAGFWLGDYESMRFWIIMAAFFMVLRELYEIRSYLKSLYEEVPEEPEARINTDELPISTNELREIRIILERLLEDEDNAGGRHSGV